MNVDEDYGDDTRLNQRAAIWRWATPWRDVFTEALAVVDWTGDEVVLDVGCGNGNWLRRRPAGARAVGLDRSVGMLTAAVGTGVPLVQADVVALPIRTAAADVALALHMLYHVPDKRAAVAELRRVVRPGGTLVVSTLGEANMVDLEDLVTVAAGLDGHRARDSLSFTLEAAPAVLGAAFDDVEVVRWTGELVVPETDPVVAYVDSLRPGVATDRPWDDVLADVRRRVAVDLPWRCRTDVGVLRCR